MHHNLHLILITFLTLTFVLSACRYVDDEHPNRVTYELSVLDTQGIASGNDITITFEKTSDWDAGSGNRGFTANLIILNATSDALEDWKLEFHFLAEITSMWNASYTEVDNTFTITPAN